MEKLSAFVVYIPLIVLAWVLLEWLYVVISGKKRDHKETLANVSIWGVGQLLKIFVTGGFFLGVLMPLKKYALINLPQNVITFALTFLVADFIYYWNHRISHEIRFFWAYHSVHHSSHEYNFSTGIRLPWVGILGDSFFYIPAVLLGFDPIVLGICKSLVLFGQEWIHTEHIRSLGWFDRWFNSPSNHRVHHGSNQVYLDKNHGGIFMIWDRLFGTYQPELKDVPVVFGLTKPLESKNPWTINFQEFTNMLKQVWQAESFSKRWGLIFRAPT